MMRTDKLITEKKELIVEFAQKLKENPELGFKENVSSAIVKEYWEKIGLKVEGPFAGTGLRAEIKGLHDGPTLCLIGELDAVANSKGVSHACGHFIQTSQVFAAACALVQLKEQIYGKVIVMAVPAEEFLEIELRSKMRSEGKISYLSGKPELLKLGVFDDVDMVAMIHANPSTPDYKLFLEGGNLGFTAKNIRFTGKAAHGAEPFEGINALEAANLFMTGVNSNRSTFRDEESIRIHPIITKGGSVVNSVPDDVRIETYVRGKTQKAIEKGCAVVDRCAKAAAMMMGCEYSVETEPGYLPINQDHELSEAMKTVAEEVLGKDKIGYGVSCVGSTDMGDISQLLPSIQPTMGGFDGELHSTDFCVKDIWKSCLLGGELLSGLALSVLGDGASTGKRIVENFKPLLNREQYFRYMDNR